MEFDLENPFITSEDDPIADLFAVEADFMCSPLAGTAKQATRQDAVSLLSQAQFAWRIDPFLTYLAVNYVDRFLSKSEIPSGKPWIVRLLTIACVSLAAKMMKMDISLFDLRRNDVFIFDGQTIHRMEMLVLGALEWRMRSITPFCFINHFTAFFIPDLLPHLQTLKNRAVEAVLNSQSDIRILEFKPSLIAASAVLSAANELFPIQFASINSGISDSEFIDAEKLIDCLSLTNDATMVDSESTFEMVSSSADTPVTVLCGATDLSSTASESDLTVESISDDRDVKKRRTGEGPGGTAGSLSGD